MKQHELNGKTRRIFDEDAYISKFEAEVISCEDIGGGKFAVVLDATAFFPEAGGQPSDSGIIISHIDGSESRVLSVEEKGDKLVHITDSKVHCGKITGTIDWDRRYERMRNHSGEHLLSGLAHTMFSCTNVGFHLNDETVTVDFDRQLSSEQILTLESSVNDAIAENVGIKAYYPEADELSELDYRSKLELIENIRIVVIDGYDMCACCAPHVASTAEIGMLLITDSINYKGGTRLNMVCGKNACKYARMALSNTREIAGMLSAKHIEAAQAVKRYISQANEEKAKSAAIANSYIDLRLLHIDKTDGNIVLFEPSLDRNQLRRLVDRSADCCGGICAGFTGNDSDGWTYIMISRSRDLKALSKRINERINGRGGGSPQMIQGTALAEKSMLEKVFDDIE